MCASSVSPIDVLFFPPLKKFVEMWSGKWLAVFFLFLSVCCWWKASLRSGVINYATSGGDKFKIRTSGKRAVDHGWNLPCANVDGVVTETVPNRLEFCFELAFFSFDNFETF